MPTYEHECSNPECNWNWEADYSIKVDPPKTCPKCNQETAHRVINCISKGVVELDGNELVARTKQETEKLKRDANQSSKLYANLIGEEKYHKIQTQMDRAKRDRKGDG